MLGCTVMFVAAAFAATTVATSPVHGTLVSIGVAASGTVLAIDRGSAVQTTVTVPDDAVVRERAVGEQWRTIAAARLMVGEPVTVSFDQAGRVREVDAEYARIDTRAVIVQHGYLVGTDGVARKLVAAAAIADDTPLGAYVELRTDPATGQAFDASVSSRPFASAANAAVSVTFDVRVPVNTPPASTIYLATNAQSWTPNAIRLAPEPGNRWTATISLPAGTELQYKYTRGSWASGERDAAGAELPNRTLKVARVAKGQRVDDVVVRWADLPS